MTGRGLLERVDDRPVVVALVPHELQKLRQRHVMAAQKRAVAGAAVHEVGVQLAAQFGARLGDEAREPDDAIHRGRLGGEGAHRHDPVGRLPVVHDFGFGVEPFDEFSSLLAVVDAIVEFVPDVRWEVSYVAAPAAMR
jgi:hypothetical protein